MKIPRIPALVLCLVAILGLQNLARNHKFHSTGQDAQLGVELPTQISEKNPAEIGWWWNPNEGGRGFFIDRQADQLLLATNLYDTSGSAIWYLAGPSALNQLEFSSALFAPSLSKVSGPNSQPAQPRQPLGPVNIRFIDTRHAVLQWAGGSIPIERYKFNTDNKVGPVQGIYPQTGWWYDPTKPDKKFAIETQQTKILVTAFSFDKSGSPIWHLSDAFTPPTMGSHTVTWKQYEKGQAIQGAYKVPRVVKSTLGKASFRFLSATEGTATLADGLTLTISHRPFK